LSGPVISQARQPELVAAGTAYYAGAIVPLIGLALAPLNMATTPILLGALFMAIDVVVIGCCVYLLLKVRPGAHVHR
jgi:hypothetical protein